MAEPAKDIRSAKIAERKAFKYPSEDETYVRRLGSAVLAHWNELSDELRSKILTEAAVVWDREYNVPQLTQKLDNFVRRYPGRVR
ncbi:MAG: hypothetical protein KGL56_07415 [Alphaproteobacteria bacterium]|jgi:hypothetical protein|nr:hypothetical protein [Alphaproteobacteria bacterium]MDE2164258.1 hypothetical protein [Alphaproteobacteria bacterium]MDE2500005.1 hypothetical protein [Alphaproteobacteria bacterium]